METVITPKKPFLDKIKETFEELDAFGQPISFFYNGKEKYKTLFGASLTVLAYIFVLLLSLTIIKAALYKDDIQFNSAPIYLSDPGHLPLTTQAFHLSILIDDPTHSFDNSMLGIRIRWANYTRFPNGTLIREKKSIPMRLCTIEDYAEYPKEFELYRLNAALCAVPTEIPLAGDFLSDTFQFLEVLAEECDQSIHGISGITCAPKDDRDLYFSKNKVKLQIFFKNYNVNPSNLDKPFHDFIDNIFYVINQGQLAKSVDILLKEVELTSYENFINSEKDIVRNTYTHDAAGEAQIYVNMKDPNEYLSVQFRKSYVKLSYTRSLTKLVDLIAHFGGIWGILYSLGSLAASTHNNLEYQKSIADRMFWFSKENQSTKKTSAPYKITPQKKSNGSDPESHENLDLISQGIIRKQTIFKSVMSYIFSKLFCFTRDSEKAKIAQQTEGLELAKKKIDIMYIVKKLEEFEKMKYVLFDKNQIALFDYIPPPIVKTMEVQIQNKKTRMSQLMNTMKHYDPKNELMEKYKTPESILRLYEIYREAKTGNEVSRKLVEMLGYKALIIFRFLDHSKPSNATRKTKQLLGIRRALRY